MKKLFLASYFAQVATLLPKYINEECVGKKVAFIPTASNVEKVTFYVAADKKALQKLGLTVNEIDIAKATQAEIKNTLNECDYIFVGGGNTFYLLQELKRTGCDRLIKKHIASGKLYIGSSAGSIILAPDIAYIASMDDPKLAPNLSSHISLHAVDFFVLPHRTNFPFKSAAQKIENTYKDKLKLIPISNNQVVVVTGDVINTVTK